MFGSSPIVSTSPSVYATNLRESLTAAYNLARQKMGAQLQRQKQFYDHKIHGKPYDVGDLVWLFSPAVPPGQSKKLHHPWSGPFEIVKHLTDATYRIANQAAKRQRFVVHFDRLKPCVSGTRFNKPQIEHNTDHDHSEPNSSSVPFGTHLQLVDNGDPTTTRRYPQRIRRSPDRLHEVVSH